LRLKILLFLLCFLSIGAASAYADPTLSVEKVRDYTVQNGTNHEVYRVSVQWDKHSVQDRDSYSFPFIVKRIEHWANGQSVTTTIDQINKYDFPTNDGIREKDDDVSLLRKDPSCPNVMLPCIPVVKVDYVVIASDYQTVLASASVTPGDPGSVSGGDPGEDDTGGGTNPGGGSGGGSNSGDTGGGTGGDDAGGGGNNPGNGAGGGDTGGGGGGCGVGCELLACPGWEDIAALFADAIGKEIPPPPDWEEVAETFGNELIPRFEEMLGHPPAPPKIEKPSVPNMDSDIVESIWPTATDSTPPATKPDFGSVPDMQINPDNTGGIDLRNADPTESIPHDPPGYTPIPGQENGGITPQTKPIETPAPSGGGVAQPPPDALPTPGTSAGELPTPGSSTEAPPVPTLPPP